MYVCVYVCMCVCMYGCVYVCMYVLGNTSPGRIRSVYKSEPNFTKRTQTLLQTAMSIRRKRTRKFKSQSQSPPCQPCALEKRCSFTAPTIPNVGTQTSRTTPQTRQPCEGSPLKKIVGSAPISTAPISSQLMLWLLLLWLLWLSLLLFL